MLRKGKIGQMIYIYDGIGTLIIKLESLILNQGTGNSHIMKYYYNQWEKQIFESFVKFTNFNLTYLNNFLNNSYLLYTIEATLQGSEVEIQPSFVKFFNIIGCSVIDFLKRYCKV